MALRLDKDTRASLLGSVIETNNKPDGKALFSEIMLNPL